VGRARQGYEVEKGVYALFTKEELAKIEGDEAAGAIEIVEFVDPAAIDLAYIDKSYWVGPVARARAASAPPRDLEKVGRVRSPRRGSARERARDLRPRGRSSRWR